jgi:hypothetical protein
MNRGGIEKYRGIEESRGNNAKERNRGIEGE